MNAEEMTRLREENEQLKAELAAVKHRWERELVIAKASLMTVQDELDAVKARLRAALLRNIEAEDEVFRVREEAAQAVKTALEDKPHE